VLFLHDAAATMGCMQSKKSVELVAPPEGTTSANKQEDGPSGAKESQDGFGRLLPGSKVPPTPEEAREYDQPRNPRLSIKYQSKEISGRMSTSRRSSTPFDRARIGTHTRHGLMPGPRGFSAAKINQDRGVVCWPFNGSYNQALLCVFDGHGSKGERASEFCMKTVPELLEQDSVALKKDPVDTMRRANVKTDELLFASELGKTAMTCGTTSTVLYMSGSDCWTACAGDSRAVKGARRGGQLVAQDLSQDHKPDLPDERARILSRGGTVSDGTAGRPSRVWAHGRIGLAMSRSIGDGECKAVGVIADPDVTHFELQPPETAGADGDLFVIVASDGVWEFIESAEACSIVAKYKNATEACSQLVHEAASRWKRFEGSYRDDITAIVAFLPFLEAGWADEEEGHEPIKAEEGETEAASVFINMGKEGIVGLDDVGGSARSDETATEEDEGEAGESNTEEFAARRLSVHNPYDDDWNDKDGDEDDDDEEAPPPGQQQA